MSPWRVTLARTVKRLQFQLSTAFAAGAFLAVTAVLFAFGMEDAEGSRLPISAVWAAAVSPVLPALAPMTISITSRLRLSCGHTSKSAVA